MAKLTFDFNFLMKEFLPSNGLNLTHLKEAQVETTNALKFLLTKVKNNELGFLNLPKKDNQSSEIIDWTKSVKDKFDSIVVLGIGGSSLGPLMLFQTFCHPSHNTINKPKIFFLDNVDPETINATLDVINLKTTLFIVISKSGTTIETISQFSFFVEKIKKTKNNWEENFVIITDPAIGPLRKIAQGYNIKSFYIPENVGGRFSVLTPVGMLPAALMGIDILSILKGADEMAQSLETTDFTKNPALFAGSAICYLYKKSKITDYVLFPYSDRLSSFADWFLQLWAESIGKKNDLNGKEVNVGHTPLKAVGVRDQHSLLQLFTEGPHNKMISFIEIEKFRSDNAIPTPQFNHDSFLLLNHLSFSKLINAEKMGTEFALTKSSRPNFTIKLSEISEKTLGKLIMFFEVLTAITGYALNINPFDQPGVEIGKKYTKALLGDVKLSGLKSELKDFQTKNKKYILEA